MGGTHHFIIICIQLHIIILWNCEIHSDNQQKLGLGKVFTIAPKPISNFHACYISTATTWVGDGGGGGAAWVITELLSVATGSGIPLPVLNDPSSSSSSNLSKRPLNLILVQIKTSVWAVSIKIK